MSTEPPSYLVEWYRPAGPPPVVPPGAGVALLLTIAVPADEVVFGLFTGASAESIERACREAGHSPVRVTPAVGTFPRPTSRSTS